MNGRDSINHIETLDPAMVEVLKAKTPAERLAIAHDMWAHARRLIENVLRTENPEWSLEMINREVSRRISHGSV